jgi:hypothetical protein
MDPVNSAGFPSQVSTAGLPNGVPEDQLKDAKNIILGISNQPKEPYIL